MVRHGLRACAISIAVLGCTGNPAAESSAVQAEATENAALSKALQDVAIARWEGFRSLAKQLPCRGIAAVELFRTRQDQTVAVFTTVTSGQLIRSVAFGDAHGVLQPIELQAGALKRVVAGMATQPDDTSLDPTIVATGTPPPTEPTPIGILAAASDLLTTAFDGESLATGKRTHLPLTLTAAPPVVAEPENVGSSTVDPAALLTEAEQVMTARWEGFRSLAKQLPNREVLAVELLRTRQDGTVAVFTVVENGAPVKYAVGGDAHGNVPSSEAGQRVATSNEVTLVLDDGGLDPAAVAAGLPPPTEPIRPGIISVGQDLLLAVFQGD